MNLPKKAAKRIQKHYTPVIQELGPPMPLHEAQGIVAIMLGYEDWHDLEQITKQAKYPPSQLDENCSVQEQDKRLAYQANVLGGVLPFSYAWLYELALKFRVSAGSPISSLFKEDGYRQNVLFYSEPYDEAPQWRYRASARSWDNRDDLYKLNGKWGRGEINFEDYKSQLDGFREVAPEDIVPYLYYIEAVNDIHKRELATSYLPKLEAIIIQCIPSSYPMKKKVPPLIWGHIENRDYLRSLYQMAESYYVIGNYIKAKQWFLFLTRCSPFELGNEIFYLVDMRQASPEGDVHMLKGKELCARYLSPVSGKLRR